MRWWQPNDRRWLFWQMPNWERILVFDWLTYLWTPFLWRFNSKWHRSMWWRHRWRFRLFIRMHWCRLRVDLYSRDFKYPFKFNWHLKFVGMDLLLGRNYVMTNWIKLASIVLKRHNCLIIPYTHQLLLKEL